MIRYFLSQFKMLLIIVIFMRFAAIFIQKYFHLLDGAVFITGKNNRKSRLMKVLPLFWAGIW